MLNPLRIGTRLAVAFALLLALLGSVAAVSLSRLDRLSEVTQSLVDVQVQKQYLAHVANQHALSAANQLLILLQTPDRDRRVGLYQQMDGELDAGDLAITRLDKMLSEQPSPSSSAELAQLNRLKVLRRLYNDRFYQTVNLIELAGPDKARTRFIEVFQAQPADARGAVLVFDINRFSLINHALGQQVGDRLLREIGARLSSLLVQQQLLVRLWADQFALLLPDADLAAAQALGARMTALLRTPQVLDGQRLDVEGTLGIALFPQDGRDAPTLLRRAELAARGAKRHRLPWLSFAESGAEPTHSQLSLIGEMRDALTRNEFVLFYQPKVDLRAGRMTSAEALLRWRHPERGMIAPGLFIPFAEQTGFIREITPWLLDQVMAHAAAWRQAGCLAVPSVNLSAHDLLNPDLAEQVAVLLRRHGLTPDALCLEITESALMEDPAQALALLERLSSLGVKLSIDDYGSGQASLGYLKTLPVDELKIDRVFVDGIADTPKNAAIVRSTILLCHELGLSVVAEGAETADELDWLRANGCDLVQGYVLARPMPLEQFLAWQPPVV